MNINSLAHFKVKYEAENFHQIPSNIARQKLSSHISSQTTIKRLRQINVRNELSILRTIIMAKFNNELIKISGMRNH